MQQTDTTELVGLSWDDTGFGAVSRHSWWSSAVPSGLSITNFQLPSG